MATPENTDLYKVLGVTPNATEPEIRSAYKKLAVQYHPDRHVGDTTVNYEEKFKEVGEAFEVLSNEEKRRTYDKLGLDGLRKGKVYKPKPPRDIFEAFFGERDPYAEFQKAAPPPSSSQYYPQPQNPYGPPPQNPYPYPPPGGAAGARYPNPNPYPQPQPHPQHQHQQPYPGYPPGQYVYPPSAGYPPSSTPQGYPPSSPHPYPPQNPAAGGARPPPSGPLPSIYVPTAGGPAPFATAAPPPSAGPHIPPSFTKSNPVRKPFPCTLEELFAGGVKKFKHVRLVMRDGKPQTETMSSMWGFVANLKREPRNF